ncbi:hypothetical protein GR927_41990 [Mycolicibacterium sp. 3033]|nr:hypothetical protein [Mycolicibacterium aurantiacum]
MTTVDSTVEAQERQQLPVPAAPVPVAAAGASKVAVVLAILLAALGVIGVRDAAIGLGWVSGSTWLPAAVTAADGVEPADWMAVAGVAVMLVGLVLIAIALSPRRRTAVAVSAQTPMYLTVDGIAALAGAAARDVAGVVDARATSSRRRVVVRCRVTSADTDAMRHTITDTVTRTLAVLQSPPRVVVRTRTEEI